jgi:hypothetical protein
LFWIDAFVHDIVQFVDFVCFFLCFFLHAPPTIDDTSSRIKSRSSISFFD